MSLLKICPHPGRIKPTQLNNLPQQCYKQITAPLRQFVQNFTQMLHNPPFPPPRQPATTTVPGSPLLPGRAARAGIPARRPVIPGSRGNPVPDNHRTPSGDMPDAGARHIPPVTAEGIPDSRFRGNDGAGAPGFRIDRRRHPRPPRESSPQHAYLSIGAPTMLPHSVHDPS